MLARDVAHPFVRGLLPPVLALLLAAPALVGCVINPIPTPERTDAPGGASASDAGMGMADTASPSDFWVPPVDLLTPPADAAPGDAASDVAPPPDGADDTAPDDGLAGDGLPEDGGGVLEPGSDEGDEAYSGDASMF